MLLHVIRRYCTYGESHDFVMLQNWEFWAATMGASLGLQQLANGPVYQTPFQKCFEMALICKYMYSVLNPLPDFLLWSD